MEIASPYSLSRRVPSATRPPLRTRGSVKAGREVPKTRAAEPIRGRRPVPGRSLACSPSARHRRRQPRARLTRARPRAARRARRSSPPRSPPRPARCSPCPPRRCSAGSVTHLVPDATDEVAGLRPHGRRAEPASPARRRNRRARSCCRFPATGAPRVLLVAGPSGPTSATTRPSSSALALASAAAAAFAHQATTLEHQRAADHNAALARAAKTLNESPDLCDAPRPASATRPRC